MRPLAIAFLSSRLATRVRWARWRAPRRAGVMALALGLAGASPALAAAPGRATSVEALSRRLQTWVADADPAANARAIAQIRQGVPPGAMVAFLVAVREHPSAQYAPVVDEATRYRRLQVRGHAQAAWAALGPGQASQAVARAADDPELGIRRLALVLAQSHPSPAAEEVVAELLAKDPALAAQAAESDAVVPEPDAPQDDEAQDIVIIDDEPVPESTP